MGESSYCKYCGKALLWVTTNSGARMPLDKDEHQQRWVTDAAQNPMTAKLRRTYTSHMDTCTRTSSRGTVTEKEGKVEDGPGQKKLFGSD